MEDKNEKDNLISYGNCNVNKRYAGAAKKN